MFIMVIIWTTYISVNHSTDTFSSWVKTNRIVQVDTNLKPIKINNVYNIVLKVGNFNKPNLNWIKFKLENNNPKWKYIITNIVNSQWNYFFDNQPELLSNYTLDFDKYNTNTSNWNINLAYVIPTTNVSNNIKTIKFNDIDSSLLNDKTKPLILSITSTTPFNITLYNYKYKTKKDARWKIQYNKNHIIVNSNIFINKIN